jgi:hypothetical protein
VKHSIFLITANPKAVAAITAYFSDTESIPSVIRSKGDYSTLFSSKPDIIFFQGDWADSKTTSRFAQFKSEFPRTKFFSLGETGSPGFAWDGSIEFPIDEKVFRKTVLAKSEFPKSICLLTVSGDSQLMKTVKDYFEARQNPEFSVLQATDEPGTLKHFGPSSPHCLIVDLSTVPAAADIFRRFEEKGLRIPAVVFTNSVTGDQIIEVRKWKAPVFMELSRVLDSMPDLYALVKKLVVFS